jgi:protein-S-isoprenylcysteine O-methyltransferase Ste14
MPRCYVPNDKARAQPVSGASRFGHDWLPVVPRCTLDGMTETLSSNGPLPDSDGSSPPTRDPHDRGPDVKFPPPLAYVLAIGAGLLLDRIAPLGWLRSHPAAEILGGVVAIAGLVLVYVGILTFRRARTAIYPNRPAKRVVDHGVYRFTRNPMYVGMTAFHLGLSVMLASTWALLLLPVALLIITTQVIHREERHLLERFPVEYGAYCARVRRWI